MGRNYREIKGDIIEIAKTELFDVIVHGCNCFNLMGAGLALQIKNKIPEAYEVDKRDSRLPIRKFGDFTSCFHNNMYVINMYTQFNPGANFDINAFILGIKKLKLLFAKGTTIGFPQIGCGIGGGNWNKVRKIIMKELSSDYNIIVVKYHK